MRFDSFNDAILWTKWYISVTSCDKGHWKQTHCPCSGKVAVSTISNKVKCRCLVKWEDLDLKTTSTCVPEQQVKCWKYCGWYWCWKVIYWVKQPEEGSLWICVQTRLYHTALLATADCSYVVWVNTLKGEFFFYKASNKHSLARISQEYNRHQLCPHPTPPPHPSLKHTHTHIILVFDFLAHSLIQ